MAQKANCNNVSDKRLGIKIEGELDNFQIIEDRSDSEDDDRKVSKSSRAVDLVPKIPSCLMKPGSTPTVSGSVAVTNSENVVIGNNTYFNGPVTIKQVIQGVSGFDNPSYIKSEDEHASKSQNRHESKHDSTVKRFHIQRWHKITFSAVCVIILGGIVVILSIILSHSSQEDTSSSNLASKDSSGKPNYTKVVGLTYENINLIIFTILLVPLTFMLMFYTLLTLNGSGDNKTKRDPDGIEDTCEPYLRRTKADPLIIAPDHLRIVSRTDWLAQPVEKSLERIKQPVPWVIISHSATENCSTQSECILRVRLIQMFHIESRKWDDIGYNFLVAGDGSAYFGRGWDYVGAHTLGYNKYSIGISFIGTFNNDPPPKKQLDACKKLLKRGVDIGKLDKNYKLFAHRQLASTLSPGDKLYDIIKHWPHFVKNFTSVNELLPAK